MANYQVIHEANGEAEVKYYDEESGVSQVKIVIIADCESDAEILERYEQHLWTFENRLKLKLFKPVGEMPHEKAVIVSQERIDLDELMKAKNNESK